MATNLSRRAALERLALALGSVGACATAGCAIENEAAAAVAGLEAVWGTHGVREGRLHKPRAIAIGADDCLYIADLTDRIQVFDREGRFLRGWKTPGLNVDGPSGLTVDSAGRVLVADTHFYRVLVYDRQGGLLQQIGDGVQGTAPGRFGYPTDVVVDHLGQFYVSEYGDFDRIQVFSPDGRFVRQWGGHGYEPGQFLRPRALAIDAAERLYVADSCNHRIQVFDLAGDLVRAWGERGSGPGQMAFPYDVALAPDGALFVCEYGNSRVQKFSPTGESLGLWGRPGREPGCLDNPYALAVDRSGAVHVVDSGNHRLERVRF
jgi:DNA-binding beta-propeller fold protein YncE